MPAPRSKDQRSETMRQLGQAITHSVEIVVALGIGVGLGVLAERRWPGIHPWGLIGGLILGAGAMFRSMYRIIFESDADAHRNRRGERHDG